MEKMGIFGALCAGWHVCWKVEKFADDEAYERGMPYGTAEWDGNLVLNEGADELWRLVGGTGATKYDNSNAYLGVGDDDTAASASQTGLQAVANKVYKEMHGGAPTLSANQEISFVAVFGSGDANYSWREFTVVNASTDTGKNLCRKVSNQGAKASGQTWTLTYTITLS